MASILTDNALEVFCDCDQSAEEVSSKCDDSDTVVSGGSVSSSIYSQSETLESDDQLEEFSMDDEDKLGSNETLAVSWGSNETLAASEGSNETLAVSEGSNETLSNLVNEKEENAMKPDLSGVDSRRNNWQIDELLKYFGNLLIPKFDQFCSPVSSRETMNNINSWLSQLNLTFDRGGQRRYTYENGAENVIFEHTYADIVNESKNDSTNSLKENQSGKCFSDSGIETSRNETSGNETSGTETSGTFHVNEENASSLDGRSVFEEDSGVQQECDDFDDSQEAFDRVQSQVAYMLNKLWQQQMEIDRLIKSLEIQSVMEEVLRDSPYFVRNLGVDTDKKYPSLSAALVANEDQNKRVLDKYRGDFFLRRSSEQFAENGILTVFGTGPLDENGNLKEKPVKTSSTEPPKRKQKPMRKSYTANDVTSLIKDKDIKEDGQFYEIQEQNRKKVSPRRRTFHPDELKTQLAKYSGNNCDRN